MFVDFGLFGDAVVLEFEVEIFGAESLLEPVDRAPGFFEVVVEDVLGNFAGEAAAESDEAFAVLGENFFVDARLVIVALEVGVGDEFDEVFVAGFVFGEENEMVVNVFAAGAAFLFETRTGGDVDFAADDGFDVFSAEGLVKIDGAVEDAVVGDGEGAEVQFGGAFGEFVQAASGVEQRILGVKMKMDKIDVRRHGENLRRGWEWAQVERQFGWGENGS